MCIRDSLKGLDIIGVVDAGTTPVMTELMQMISAGELRTHPRGGFIAPNGVMLLAGCEVETREGIHAVSYTHLDVYKRQDARPRHQGLSHHSLTVLSRVCKVGCLLPLPHLRKDQMGLILEQVEQEGLLGLHDICIEEENGALERFRSSKLKFTTMGRGVDEDPEFFAALAAAAQAVIKVLAGQALNRINSM